jgi:hypothetical protein
MPISIPTITNIANITNSNTNWGPPAIVTSVLDLTNPNYPRFWRLDNSYLTLNQSNVTAGIELSAVLVQLLTIAPTLTWPPVINTQPVNSLNAVPTAAGSFSIVASAELAITYQWAQSTNGGISYSNLSNGGIYANCTTNTLNISNVNGLNGYQFECIATDASGSTTSNPALLTTDPAVTTQPSNVSVVHPAATSFSVVATGQTALSYQWASNSGAGYSNLSNSPPYSNVTTATMNISNSTGLNGYLFHCLVTDSNGVVTSSPATLTVS